MLGESPQREAVRRRLEEAQQSRTRVDLTLLKPDGEQRDERHPVTTIEQVRDEDVIISQPMIHGRKLPLATNELVRLTLVTASGAVLTGQTKCLGRFRMQSGGEAPFYGFRVEFPDTLHIDERRTEQRRSIPPECSPQCELRTLEGAMPIHGMVENMSTGGLRLRCRNAGDKLALGQVAYVDLELEGASSPFSATVRVCSVEPIGEDAEARFVSVAFDQPQTALEEYIALIDRCRRTACAA